MTHEEILSIEEYCAEHSKHSAKYISETAYTRATKGNLLYANVQRVAGVVQPPLFGATEHVIKDVAEAL